MGKTKRKGSFNFTAFFMINLIIVSSLLFSSFAQARTAEDIVKELKKAARSSVAIYKSGGMSGLTDATQNCYSKLDKYKFYCVYLDIASRHIDQFMVEGAAQQGMRFPKNEFFDDEQFLQRVGGVFLKANMNMNQSNEYLDDMTPIINKLVEENLMKK